MAILSAMLNRTVLWMWVLTLTGPLVTASLAQGTETPPTDQAVAFLGQDPEQSFAMQWSLTGGYAYQLRARINDGGRVSWARAHAHLEGQMPMNDELDLLVGLRYQNDEFGFDAAAGSWGDINTVQMDAALRWQATEHWQVFGGGQVIFSAEQGAGFDDAFTGGGAIGAVYGFNDRLALGLGVGVRSRILDDALIYPVVIVEWGITDRLRLSTRLTSGWANQTGVELIYDLADGVQVGVAAVYDYQQFRLSDDNATAAGGAGESEMLPVCVFIAYDIADNVAITAFVGANVAGSLKATDTSSAIVWETDYDAAPVVGIQATIRF